ncbi:unnamed protein product, partial [Prunus brigantina]
ILIATKSSLPPLHIHSHFHLQNSKIGCDFALKQSQNCVSSPVAFVRFSAILAAKFIEPSLKLCL